MIARIIESNLADGSRNFKKFHHFRALTPNKSKRMAVTSRACKPARNSHRLDHVTKNAKTAPGNYPWDHVICGKSLKEKHNMSLDRILQPPCTCSILLPGAHNNSE